MAFPIRLTAKLSGATVGQLRYWYRQQILIPEIESKRAPFLYSFRDLIALRTFAYLRSNKYSLKQVRKMLNSLRDLDMLEHPAKYSLVTMGRTVAVHVDETTTIDLIAEPGQEVVGTLVNVFGEFVTRANRRVDDLYRPRPGLTVSPERLGGWPTIAGTRVPYDAVADLLSDGSVTPEQVGYFYPNVTPAAAADALEYSREVDGFAGVLRVA